MLLQVFPAKVQTEISDLLNHERGVSRETSKTSAAAGRKISYSTELFPEYIYSKQKRNVLYTKIADQTLLLIYNRQSPDLPGVYVGH